MTCSELTTQINMLNASIAGLNANIATYDSLIAIQKIQCIAQDQNPPNPFTYTSAVARLEQLTPPAPPYGAYVYMVLLYSQQGQFVQARDMSVIQRDILQAQFVSQGC
jgi:hypothetical protein